MTVTAKPRQSAATPAPQRINARINSGAFSAASATVTRRVRKNVFPKSARLLKHSCFQHVYETGRKQFSPSMIFFYLLKDGAPSFAPGFARRVGTGKPQYSSVNIGLTVGRALGGAVDRNRIKRRMRDVVRHNLAGLQNALSVRGLSAEVVINPKKSALTADIATLRAEVERGFAIIAGANVSAGEKSSR